MIATAITGGCQCGAVRFRIRGALGRPSICHCRMCQKAFGNFFAPLVTAIGLEWTRGAPATFASSNKVRRGFCRTCGSALFFDPPARDWIAIAMGAFDKPTGTRLAKHIFTADKGDYYDIADGVPQEQRPPA